LGPRRPGAKRRRRSERGQWEPRVTALGGSEPALRGGRGPARRVPHARGRNAHPATHTGTIGPRCL